jgi:cobalt/nickel transport protein
MSELVRKSGRKILLHCVALPLLVGAVYYFSVTPTSWKGVDEAVVERIAKEHGREAKPPLIDPGSGDLLLFAFLLAGCCGGFAAGYYWRDLTTKKEPQGRPGAPSISTDN